MPDRPDPRRALRYTVIVGAAGTVGMLVAPPLAVAALSAVGFGSTGVVAGSAAAAIQSTYGGTVAAGSAFAFAQSLTMGGAAAAATISAAGGVGAACIAAGASITSLFSGKKTKPAEPGPQPPETPPTTAADKDMESHDSPEMLNDSTNHDSNIIPDLTSVITNLKYVGGGAFGDVYSASGFVVGQERKKVALKILRVTNEESLTVKTNKKLRREIEFWRSLNHPSVLPFYGACEVEERLCMVSQWVEGGPCLKYLEQNPSANRSRLLWQTSSALEYIHSGRDVPPIVHGDLKADNVLVSATGDALLSDVGLSRYVEEMTSKSGGSSTGLPGHIRFMAPEIAVPPKATPHKRSTIQSDVFGFASLMLQIYTEKPPFNGLSDQQVALELDQGRHPPRPAKPLARKKGLDDRIWILMLDCWEYEPSERPTMKEVMVKMARVWTENGAI